MILAKVTLIWVSKPDKPFRIISIPKRLVFIVLGGCSLLFLVSVFMLYGAKGYFDQRRADQQESIQLRRMLTEKEASYLDQQNQKEQLLQAQTEELSEKTESLKALQEQLSNVMQQLSQIRSSESKIRRFLGLEDKGADAKHPNQGGIGFIDIPPYPYGDVSSLPETKDMFPSSTTGLSNSLQNSMRELLDYLEHKQEEANRLPTILPVAANDLWMSCGFGWRSNPFTGKGKEFHFGLDIAGPWKSPIPAPADGEVIETGENRFLGNYVKIRHGKRLTTLYGHLQAIEVSEGDKVKREDLIGYMGNTGRSTGIHLHYSVLKDGKYVDPLDYIWDRTIPTLAQGNKSDEVF